MLVHGPLSPLDVWRKEVVRMGMPLGDGLPRKLGLILPKIRAAVGRARWPRPHLPKLPISVPSLGVVRAKSVDILKWNMNMTFWKKR